MALLNFKKRATEAEVTVNPEVEAFLQDYSIEVMPRTAQKVEDFRELLPAGTRVYIAHIEGTPIEDMVATAKRLNDEGFPVMPHLTPNAVEDRLVATSSTSIWNLPFWATLLFKSQYSPVKSYPD